MGSVNVELPGCVVEEILVESLKEQYNMFCENLEKRYDEPIGSQGGGVFYSNREKDIVAIKEYLKALKRVLWSNMPSKYEFNDFFKIQEHWEKYYDLDEEENK